MCISMAVQLHSGIVTLNVHVVINILNLNHINNFILYSSITKLSNDMRYN